MSSRSAFGNDAPGAPTTHRVASVLYMFLGLAFGLSVPWVLAFLAENGYLPMMFWFRAMGGPFEGLGRGAFVVAGLMLVAVSLLDVIAGVLLWRGRHSGALLGLATDPIAMALGWGFALPLLLIGVPVRALLVLTGLRRSQ
jgi:hypothetical protein